MLGVAAALCVLIGTIHSYLGERFILIRLFRNQNIPQLFGSDYFTKRTLRFAWHITTVAWFGFGYILFVISQGNENITRAVLFTISIAFFITGALAFGFTRGRHISWLVFWTIAGLSYFATNNF
jgi:hypothetical protein